MSKKYVPIEKTDFGKKAAGPVGWLDQRLGLTGMVNPKEHYNGSLMMPLRKVFPEHWSFMLGEMAMWSFAVLLLSGTFLTLWFQPSQAEVVYNGSYAPLKGLEMSTAYASTLDISFDIRGGLLMRQVHHWSAMIFIAAMMFHMLRIFFTGAFRKPRELNWCLGLGLLMLGILEGFAGYSLPDDLLSGTGLRIADGIMRSVPIIGSYVEFFVFGGEFPGEVIVARMYIAHVFLIPGLIAAMIVMHLMLILYHKHTQFPGPGRRDDNVVGYPLMPVYAAKAGGFFLTVFGFTTLLAATIQINPIWTYGAYNPSEVTAGSQPDWYMGFAEGGLRMMPNIEFPIWNQTISLNVFVPGALLLPLLFLVLGAWPFIENWITGDTREHHVLDRPRNAPTRTALGVAGVVAFAVLWIGGGNDIIASKFRLDVFHLTRVLQVAQFVLPWLAYLATKRICIGLQHADKDRVGHGYETGIIERTPEGAYSERHAALPVTKQYALVARDAVPSPNGDHAYKTDADGVPNKHYRRDKLRIKLNKWFYDGWVDRPSDHDVEHAAHLQPHDEHPVTVGEDFQGISETGVPKAHH